MSLLQQKDLLQSNTCKLLDTSHNRLHTNLIDWNWNRHRGNCWQHTAYCRHLTAEARLSNLQLVPHMMVACASPSPWVRYCQHRQFWSETIDHCVVVYNQRNYLRILHRQIVNKSPCCQRSVISAIPLQVFLCLELFGKIVCSHAKVLFHCRSVLFDVTMPPIVPGYQYHTWKQ